MGVGVGLPLVVAHETAHTGPCVRTGKVLPLLLSVLMLYDLPFLTPAAVGPSCRASRVRFLLPLAGFLASKECVVPDSLPLLVVTGKSLSISAIERR